MVCLEAGVTAQEAFLASNFKLCSKGGNPPSARFRLFNILSKEFHRNFILYCRKLKEGQRPKASSYDKFMHIELSSPLGRFGKIIFLCTIYND